MNLTPEQLTVARFWADGLGTLGRAVESATARQQTITISIGSSTGAGDKEADALIAQADEALQHVKQPGRNRVRHVHRYR